MRCVSGRNCQISWHDNCAAVETVFNFRFHSCSILRLQYLARIVSVRAGIVLEDSSGWLKSAIVTKSGCVPALLHTGQRPQGSQHGAAV